MTKLFFMAAVAYGDMRVAMLCLAAGVLLIVVGRYVWKNEKPEYLPGYKKVKNEDTKTFCTLAGQAHMLAGTGLLMLSLPLNEKNPNTVFAVAMLIGCFIMVGLGIARYMKALKSRRK